MSTTMSEVVSEWSPSANTNATLCTFARGLDNFQTMCCQKYCILVASTMTNCCNSLNRILKP